MLSQPQGLPSCSGEHQGDETEGESVTEKREVSIFCLFVSINKGGMVGVCMGWNKSSEYMK